MRIDAAGTVVGNLQKENISTAKDLTKAVGELANRVPHSKIDAYAGTATKIAEEIVSEEEKNE
jgi:hypothetical protein